tara:strand:+ start:1267 stop:2136 length:870 start_codon:yes stop_codon:yes gene_type:complete
MLKRFTLFVYFFLKILDKIIQIFSSRFKFLLFLKEYIESKSYKKKNIKGKEIIFFCPNKATDLRIKRFFTKEPGTLEWIDNFEKSKEIIFWDIGSNIGIFSIYAAIINSNIKIISFEPSTSNLRILSRNISINNLSEKIIVSQIPLTNKKNQSLLFKENRFIEGSSSNVYGESFDQYGKNFNSNNSYKIFGTCINYLIDEGIYEIPDYIKIDVDGIEHLILDGANKYLSNKKIKGISIEINDQFLLQKNKIFDILNQNNFKFISSNRSEDNPFTKNKSVKNYIFEKIFS